MSPYKEQKRRKERHNFTACQIPCSRVLEADLEAEVLEERSSGFGFGEVVYCPLGFPNAHTP